jgi:flagellar biosynthetic protein FliR
MDFGWLTATLLIAARFGAIALVAPPIGARVVPAPVRVCLVLGVAAMLAGLPASRAGATMLAHSGGLMTAIASEVALGETMALGLLTGFAVFAFAARLVDVQIGYGVGQVVDPSTSQPVPVVTAALTQIALLLFFLLDGHHALMRGLVLSVEHFPPGRGWDVDAAFGPVVRHMALLFSLGLAMLAPVVLTLVLVDLCLGVVARNLPQVNVLALGFGIKVVVGLGALSLASVAGSSVMARAYRSVFQTWESLLQ